MGSFEKFEERLTSKEKSHSFLTEKNLVIKSMNMH